MPSSERRRASESTAVSISAMHRARGLEFNRVAVIAPGALSESDSVDARCKLLISLTAHTGLTNDSAPKSLSETRIAKI